MKKIIYIICISTLFGVGDYASRADASAAPSSADATKQLISPEPEKNSSISPSSADTTKQIRSLTTAELLEQANKLSGYKYSYKQLCRSIIRIIQELLKRKFEKKEDIPNSGEIIRKNRGKLLAITGSPLIPGENHRLGMSFEDTARMYRALSVYHDEKDFGVGVDRPDAIDRRIEQAAPYEPNLVQLWTSVRRRTKDGKSFEMKPLVCTGSLVNLEFADPKLSAEYKGRILITCSHVYGDGSLKTPDSRFVNSDTNGIFVITDPKNFRFMLPENVESEAFKIEPSKNRPTRFVQDPTYDGIYVEKIYFAGDRKDLAFCVLNKSLPNCGDGFKLSYIKNTDNAAERSNILRTTYYNKDFISVGYGSGAAELAAWPSVTEHDANGFIAPADQAIINDADELHKASGWLSLKYKQGMLDSTCTFLAPVNHGDSGRSGEYVVVANDTKSSRSYTRRKRFWRYPMLPDQ